MNRWTQLVHLDACAQDSYQANSYPIYQTATFQQNLQGSCTYDYTRSGNPTRSILEQQLAQLEGSKHAFAFTSGMAALTAICGLLKSGDHIIASDDLYGGTYRLLSERLPQRGISVTLVNTADRVAVENAFTPQTRLVLIETPSNPLQKITNIQLLASLTHQHSALLAVDNTMLSPWLQQPLLLGADIVMHSATKHLGGHSDLTAGVIMTNHDDIADKLAFIQNAEGAALAPFECWLLIRGLKTLGLRIEREQSNAIQVANFLATHRNVNVVYYPGLTQHPGYTIHKQQSNGPGTVLSFECAPSIQAHDVIANTSLFTLSVSFGSVNSLISLPCSMSHASIPQNERKFTPNLIRLSIGIEDPNDLLTDLDRALTVQRGKIKIIY